MMRILRSPSMLWLLALSAMSGCAQLLGIDDLPDAPDDAAPGGERPDAAPGAPDARPDDAGVGASDAGVPPDARAGCETWTPPPTHFDPCVIPAPSAALNLETPGEYVYDTDQAILRDPAGNEIAHASVELSGNPPVRAISVDGLLVGTATRLLAVGSKPLLVASWSEIVVQGTIDVSSDAAGNGAGANTGECTAPTAGQEDRGGGGGGGAGFHGSGGDGGTGAGGGNGGRAGGSRPPPTTVRGGCPGARGGPGRDGDGSGAGGAGGGALQLTARDGIQILGRLHAGGAGGGGANGPVGPMSGGGGGGSGGLLDLEAPTISFGAGAIVAANGGGGGEGCEAELANSGQAGQNGAGQALGGQGASPRGGDGGGGSAGSNLAGDEGERSSNDAGGGGGGGGGAGYIILTGAQSVSGGAVLSPPPTPR